MKLFKFWKKPYHVDAIMILHEIAVSAMENASIRDEWVYYMVCYYRKVFPTATEKCYFTWAASTIDHTANSLGDYFSRSHYVPGR